MLNTRYPLSEKSSLRVIVEGGYIYYVVALFGGVALLLLFVHMLVIFCVAHMAFIDLCIGGHRDVFHGEIACVALGIACVRTYVGASYFVLNCGAACRVH